MKKRVLVIDDDDDILTILNFIFEEEGYDVIVLNQEISVEEIKLIHPDVVLLDVMIKGSARTGDQICHEIKSKSITKDLPVILISAEYDLSLLAAKAGANGYIRKPFNVDSVISQVKEFLD